MIKTKTRQQLFTNAMLGLAGQGFKQSVTLGGNCNYRGPEGRQCGIGFSISDVDYDHSYEGYGASTPSISAAAGIPSHDTDWATDLQTIHDASSGPQDMQRAMIEFARLHDLAIPSVTPSSYLQITHVKPARSFGSDSGGYAP